MRIFFLACAMSVSGTCFASEFGVGAAYGNLTVPHKFLGHFVHEEAVPEVHGYFQEAELVYFTKKGAPSWILAVGQGKFRWDNPEALRGLVDVSGHGEFTAISLTKQWNFYTNRYLNAHMQSGLGAAKMSTSLDNRHLELLVGWKREPTTVPIVRLGAGIAVRPTSHLTIGIGTGLGYFEERYRFSAAYRF